MLHFVLEPIHKESDNHFAFITTAGTLLIGAFALAMNSDAEHQTRLYSTEVAATATQTADPVATQLDAPTPITIEINQ